MRFDLKKPCNECPFRKNSLAGWLGDYTAEGAVESIKNDQPFLCHKDVENRIGYDEPDWKERALEEAQHCAGALIFARKLCKLSRDPEIAEAQREINPNQEILFPPQEFIQYHQISIQERLKKIKEDKNAKNLHSGSNKIPITKRSKKTCKNRSSGNS